MLLTRVSLQHSLRAASETERHTVTNITHSPRWNRVMPLGVANKLNTSAVETAKSASPTQHSPLLLSCRDILLRLEKEDALHGSV